MFPFKKVYSLLSAAQRKSAIALVGLMVAGMALEMVGLGLIVPAIALLTQDDWAARYPQMRRIAEHFDHSTSAQLAAGGMVVLIGIYLVKTVFLGFLAWRQTKFAFDLQADLSQRLFAIYLGQPYAFHLQRNSAQLIRNTIEETRLLNGYVVTPGMNLLAEGLVLVGIAGILVVVEPVGAFVVIAVLGGAAWVFNRRVRTYVSGWGVARQHHEGLRLQHLQQGLGGAKEVKLLGREEEFLVQYGEHNRQSARVAQRQAALQQFPRLWLEFLAVAAFATIVLVKLLRDGSATDVIPTLGLFAAAAFRLMPSVSRVLSAMHSLRFGVPVVATLCEELKLTVPLPPSLTERASAFHSGIELINVAFVYPATQASALDGVSLRIRKGECVGFIGPSGSGKSTLVDVILGLLSPTAGRVIVDDRDIQLGLRGWQQQIGYVPQSIYLTDDTLRRNVAFGLPNDQIDDKAVARALEAAQLNEFVAGLPDGWGTIVGERGVRLSGGQRQRIGIARALYQDPAVLVLDEATSALDTATERSVMEAVMALQGKKTILIVAHRLSTVEHADRIYRLAQGRMVHAGPAAKIPGSETQVLPS